MPLSLQDLARVELELQKRRSAGGQTLREFIARANPRYQFYRHVDKLIGILQRVADGELTRVMVFMPPRHGKSELISRLFTAYYLHLHPSRWVGLNSYAAELSHTFSRAARENYRRMGGLISDHAQAAHHWETVRGGGMWAAGVGGPITGKGFHLGVIDDPLKNAEEAGSETVREHQKDWYNSTFYTRAEPQSAIIVVQTRWNEDDLSGWLLAEETQIDTPERWTVVNFPAICPDDVREFPPTCDVVPDFRQPGEALCPERYPLDKLLKLKNRLGPYFWAALFDQLPAPISGEFFRREWFQVVAAAPREARRVRYWDKAGSAGAGDYSVGLRMAEHDGLYYVEDIVRGQWSAGERDKVMRQTAELDGIETLQWAEQEGGSGGKESAEITVKKLAGFAVKTEPVSGSKETRARPFASQAEAGNVRLVRGAWNRTYLDELMLFPRGKHDDQVDTSSGAFNKLARGGVLLTGTLPETLSEYIGL